MKQLSIFPDPVPVAEETDTYKQIKKNLNKLNKMGNDMNRLLQGMIDELQQDWGEDTKLMVNNPKAYYEKQKQEITKPMAKELSAEALAWLQGCTVNENVVKLPENGYNREVYVEVKNRLELIGGKCKGGKIAGFVFEHDPAELLAEIAGGVKRNLKKEFQFFGTPAKLADKLVVLAEIEEGMLCLEPEAGQFAICEAIYRAFPRMMTGPNDKPCVGIDYYELMPQNCDVISKKLNVNKNWLSRSSFMGHDFLASDSTVLYDRIIANPPFSKNQDIDHITKMYTCLKPTGRLVSVCGKHRQFSSNKKEVAFGKWLLETGAQIIDVDAGEFKESGTSVATCIVVIGK